MNRARKILIWSVALAIAGAVLIDSGVLATGFALLGFGIGGVLLAPFVAEL